MKVLSSLCCTILLLAPFSATCDELHSIHERVGSTIDATERAYFRLFPSVPVNWEVRTFVAEAGGVRLSLMPPEGVVEEQREYLLNRAQVAALHDYIANFELVEDERKPVDPLLNNLVALPLPQPKAGKKGRIVTTSGERRYGRLLCISEHSLTLIPVRESYDWRRAEQYATFHDNEIERLRIDGASIGSSMFLGAGIGAALGIGTVLVSWDESASIDRGTALIMFGAAVAGVGGLLGALIAGSNPTRSFAINGDPVRFTAARAKISERARYRWPPPELNSR